MYKILRTKKGEPISNLVKRRKKEDYVQNQLINLSGLSKSLVTKFETGERDINKTSGENLFKLASVLNCNMSSLLNIEHINFNNESAISKRYRIIDALRELEYDITIKSEDEGYKTYNSSSTLLITKEGLDERYVIKTFSETKNISVYTELKDDFAYADSNNHIEYKEVSKDGTTFTTYSLPDNFDIEDHVGSDKKVKNLVEEYSLGVVSKHIGWDHDLLRLLSDLENMEVTIKTGISQYFKIY